MRQNSRGWYCATKLEDGSWCKYKPQSTSNYQNPAPRPKSSVTEAPTRNFDREAYEKCCSIWAAAYIGRAETDDVLVAISDGRFWELFQAIRKDGEKRFATGWAKAESVFKKAPSDDYEAGNKAIEEAQAVEADSVEGMDW